MWAWQMCESELDGRLLGFLLFEEALEEAFFGFFGWRGGGGSGGGGFGLGFFQVDGGFDAAFAAGLGGFVFGLLEFGEVEHGWSHRGGVDAVVDDLGRFGGAF